MSDSSFELNEDALNKLRDEIPEHLLSQYIQLMQNNQTVYTDKLVPTATGFRWTIWLPCTIYDPSKITQDVINQWKNEHPDDESN